MLQFQMAPKRRASSQLVVACLLLVAVFVQVSHDTVSCLQSMAPPPPAANFAQLAKTAASSRLLSEFLQHEKQRTSLLTGELAVPSAHAPAAAPSSARPPLGRAPHISASLAPNEPGSLFSATPTYSQALGGGGVGGSVAPFRLDAYHPLEEIYAYLSSAAKLYPRRANVFTIGYTSEQRPIKALELINNATDPDYVWLDALTHAREWITGSTILYTIDKLLLGAPTSGSNQHKMFAKNYIIIPVVNPDGYAYTWSTNRMWRKNRSKGPATSAAAQGFSRALDSGSKSCVGADLNRNFDHSFGGEGSSSDPCSHIYSGAFPFSEPETRALADLMWSLRERIKFYLTMHSFNQLWACPYAHTTEQSAHLSQHMRVLRSIQQAVYQAEGVHYEIGPLSTSLYVGSGFGIDFAYDKCAIVNSYLVELRDRGANGFVLPADQIMPTARETFAGLKAGLRMVFI